MSLAGRDFDCQPGRTDHTATNALIQELIDFALDCSGLILGILTGEENVTQYADINDWDNTLWVAQLGLKYQEYDLKQKLEGFKSVGAQGSTHES